MSKKHFVVVAAVALATTQFVFAAEPAAKVEPATDTACAREEASQKELAPRPLAVTVAEMLVAPAQEETIVVTDGVASGAGPREVVLARIDTDGQLVMSCVDSAKDAKRFLEAPVEKLTPKKAKEQ
jgi:hypothetical protein